MKTWIEGLSGEPENLDACVLTVGNFDGLHLGHQKLVEQVVGRARVQSVPAVVCTFDPHPAQVLRPESAPRRLYPLEEQERLLSGLGVDLMVVRRFTPELADVSAATFLRDFLYRHYHPRVLVVGHDFAFGSGRQGTLDFLRTHSASLGVTVEVVPPVRIGGQVVSSSRIRAALADGHVTEASLSLGRPYHIDGPVVTGDRRGRQIGFPTANMLPADRQNIAFGVYQTRVHLSRGVYQGVTNFGLRPTFGITDGAGVYETHILDFQGDLYGQHLRVEFISRLRGEQKFASVEELLHQIQADVREARLRFAGSTSGSAEKNLAAPDLAVTKGDI